MSELSRADFAKGVNDAIRALRAVYSGVRTMLDELADELEAEPAPLYDLGVRARPITSRLNPDEKILRTWEGRFFGDEATDGEDEPDDDEGAEEEEGDDEPRGRKHVMLSAGQRLAFVKIVLYHPGADEGEPHLLYGVLSNFRVPAGWPTLKLPKGRLRRVLDVVRSDMKTGPTETKASVLWPPDVPKRGGGKKARTNRLVFNVAQPPASFPLFDVRGRDQVKDIATLLKRQWADAGARDSQTPV
jgi:hypothetical protein